MARKKESDKAKKTFKPNKVLKKRQLQESWNNQTNNLSASQQRPKQY